MQKLSELLMEKKLVNTAKFKFPLMLLGLLALPPLLASPAPIAAWESASFDVATKLGNVSFAMKCPSGKLTSVIATRGKQRATLPVEQLSKFKLPSTCSGASTKRELESESSSTESGISLTVEFSREYTQEDLWVYLDLKTLQFTEVQHSFTEAGQETKVDKLKLSAKKPR
jgi:hypothetical protein